MTYESRIQFSSGWFMEVYVIRDTDLTPAMFAEAVNMPLDQFLFELNAWARGIGLPYGIKVHVEEQRIEVLGAS